MIKHIVSFKLKGSPEERLEIASRFKEALLALSGKIEVIKSIEVGINANSQEHWDLVLIVVTENFNALSEYSNHPLHLEAVAIIKDYKEDRACVDYII